MSKFTHDEEELLKLFQSEENRRAEEEFARIFTENDNVRVAFINEDRAFTDGRNIVVDPAEDKLFSDREAIAKTLKFLHLPESSCSSWSALKLTTRSQNIHECLHIIYTKFPNQQALDNYGKLTEYEKEKLIAKSRSVKSKEEMEQLIQSLGNGMY